MHVSATTVAAVRTAASDKRAMLQACAMRAEASNKIRRLHHHAVRTDDMEATPAILRGHSRNAHQHVIGTPRTYDMAGRFLLGREPLRWLF